LGIDDNAENMKLIIETSHQKPEEIVFDASVWMLREENILPPTPMKMINNTFIITFRYYEDILNEKLSIDIKQLIRSSDSSVIPPAPSNTAALTKLASMLDNPEFSDFKFIINDKEFPVHKCVLAAASEAFVKIFKVNKNFWKINDISEHIFSHLLRFIYTEKVPGNLSPSSSTKLPTSSRSTT
jgi:hypothetical protein